MTWGPPYQGTLSSLRAAAEADPSDLAARYAYANKLVHVGRAAEGNALIASIREEDPEGRTPMGARLLWWDALALARAGSPDPEQRASWNLEPLYACVDERFPSEVQFEAWNEIALAQRERRDLPQAAEAYAAAEPHVDPSRLGEWGFEVVVWVWRERELAERAQARFALRLAERVREEAERQLAAAPAPEDGGPDAEQRASIRADVLGLLARAQWLNGRERAARRSLERALELLPEDEDLRSLAAQLDA